MQRRRCGGDDCAPLCARSHGVVRADDEGKSKKILRLFCQQGPQEVRFLLPGGGGGQEDGVEGSSREGAPGSGDGKVL